jgi:cytochrome c553
MKHLALRTVVVYLILAGLAVSSRSEDLSERLAACASCHGERGEGKDGNEYYPHLAGKPAGYLRSQLQAFREGRRIYPQMTWLMRNMGDDYLTEIASFYSALPMQSSAVAIEMRTESAARARKLVEHGDAERGIPACAACHGIGLSGQEPGVPAIVGLPVDYVIAQLGAWKTGTRSASSPDCMADIARALDPADMRRLGEWLASRGVSHVDAPAPAGSFGLPRACGDMPVEAPR